MGALSIISRESMDLLSSTVLGGGSAETFVQSTTCTTVPFPGNLTQRTLENCLGRGSSIGGRVGSLREPTFHILLWIPWAHMACGPWHHYVHRFQTTDLVAAARRVSIYQSLGWQGPTQAQGDGVTRAYPSAGGKKEQTSLQSARKATEISTDFGMSKKNFFSF